MEKIQLIWAIVSTFLAVGGIAIVKKLITEIKELRDKIKTAYADGNIDPDEALEIAKEAIDVYSESLKLWNIVKRIIPNWNIVKKIIPKK